MPTTLGSLDFFGVLRFAFAGRLAVTMDVPMGGAEFTVVLPHPASTRVAAARGTGIRIWGSRDGSGSMAASRRGITRPSSHRIACGFVSDRDADDLAWRRFGANPLPDTCRRMDLTSDLEPPWGRSEEHTSELQ